MTNDSHLYKNLALTAAFGAAAAALGLYYLRWRRRSAIKDGPSAKELKDLGNKLFAAKKYEDSIRNRAAAKEHHGGFSIDDMLSDCQHALKYNPRYAKAYFRKARLLEMKKDYEGVFCATQLDSSLDTQTGQILSVLMEQLEKRAYQTWQLESHAQHSVKHVYIWLHKTVVSDCIRSDVLARRISEDTPYATALEMVCNKDYDNVADMAVQEEGAKKMNALILAARFYLYRNMLDKFSSCVEKFDALFETLNDDEKAEKKELCDARHIVCIEAGRTSEEIMKAFNFALEQSKSKNPDFYVMAGFRLVLCNDTRAAMDILSAEGIHMTNMSTSQADGAPDMAQLHNHILELEKFVSELEPKTGYALSLLAKITATFSTDRSAQLLFEDVFKLEPAESIHFFDRSCMAASATDAMEYLNKCIAIEPHHAEAHLMDEYSNIEKHLSTTLSTFADNVDFPVLMGAFRLQEVLLAKKKAADVLSHEAHRLL
ncbi:hypothetical protein ANCCEY_01739 [Ancylostoma ceylanicum]|uniref:Tetratricopeptide repeat protein n=1 Tax=Ancylostoma ceylanicum TaxID=53326 RepID=A0A0D6MCN3_9BILA|nr:hypothetical protein ANCCEY_01739 [Ancylostoma ceylanicum]